LLQNPYGLYNAVGFHSQKAAEKAIKAYLTWREDPFERTHSLVALVSQSLQFDESFEALREAATELTPYAVTIRQFSPRPFFNCETQAGLAFFPGKVEKAWA